MRVTPFCFVAVMFGPGNQLKSFDLDLRKLIGSMSMTNLPVEMLQDEMPVVAIVIRSNSDSSS